MPVGLTMETNGHFILIIQQLKISAAKHKSKN